MNKYIIALFVALFVVCKSHSQTSNIKKVESIEMNYQKCLDYGADMKGCSDKYYFFCDKLLNEVYQIIRKKCTQKEKNDLKIAQLKWLKLRDAYFKKAYEDAKIESEGLESNDLQMIYIGKKGDFVKERVVFLIKKYKI